ncbi:MAG TPA: permease-like cell division protein FtsX [bacterium]|nr:permease-like cell division protein FtsX [bacterium]HPN42570.1 permease-like cell division protein FtsX [bacterium]
MKLLYSIKEAFAGFSRARFSFFISVFAISFLLFLIGIFGMITLNVDHLIDVLHARVDIQVFISNIYDDTQIARLGSTLSALPEVESVEFISKDAAAREFQKEFGEELFSILEDNPLPSSFIVKLREKYRTETEVARVAQTVKNIPGVDDIEYQTGALSLLTRFSGIARFVNAILLVIVISGSVFVITNTIRLIIIAKQDIINTMRLVGATNSYISRPYLIEGIIQGLLGGLIASCLCWILIKGFNWRWPGVIFINMDYLYILIGGGLVIGWLSSLFAIRRYL